MSQENIENFREWLDKRVFSEHRIEEEEVVRDFVGSIKKNNKEGGGKIEDHNRIIETTEENMDEIKYYAERVEETIEETNLLLKRADEEMKKRRYYRHDLDALIKNDF